MLNSEPQTYVITSETAQIFVLPPDLSKISEKIPTKIPKIPTKVIK